LIAEVVVLDFDREQHRLLDLLYDAPGNAACWGNFLNELRLALKIDMANYVHFDDRTGIYPVTCTSGGPPGFLRDYQGYYASIDEWYLRARHSITGEYVDDGRALCPMDELKSTEFYNDFLRPNRWLHEAAIVLEMNSSAITALTMVRQERQREFSDQDLDILRAVAPHLRRASKLHHRFVDLQNYSQAQTWALDQIGCGIVLIARGGKILIANARAKNLCNGDGLSLTRKGLSASGGQQRDLDVLLGTSRTRRLDTPPAGPIAIRRNSGTELIVSAVSLPGSNELTVVFVHDPKRPAGLPGKLLAKLYRLTPAETALAVLIADGRSIPEAANLLGVSTGTARVQLKAVFNKTEVHSQSQLVKLVGGFSAKLTS